MSIKCAEVIFTPVSPLTVKLSGGTSLIVPHKIDDEIVSLEMPNDYTIPLKQCVKIKGLPYKINIIEKSKINKTLTYNLKIAERNKSSLFILPMLGGNRAVFLYNKQFINAFIGDDENKDKIILLYRYSADPLYYKFEKFLENFRDFLKSYNPDPYHSVFIFKIPEIHEKNFEKFKNGQYSKMNDLYKLRILDFHGMEIDNILGQILFKSDERKKSLESKLGLKLEKNSELLSIINSEEEILDLDYYLNCKQNEKYEV